MLTEVLRIDPIAPEPDRIARAAAILRDGGLVAFPTETVYGLGADALNPSAVAGIFAAKGRPSNNPLIVHVPDVADAAQLAGDWPSVANLLAARWWPGPLTLVVQTSPRVPDLVTAGGPTVALRVPAHPVALALLRATAGPLAAPSANRSSSLSPTQADHVLHGLRGRIRLILDAGPAPGGLESTVLDVTTAPPRLLRPGLVTQSEIEAAIGPVARYDTTSQAGQALRSPGQLTRHYAPRAPLECVNDDGESRVRQLQQQGLRVGWLVFGENPEQRQPAAITLVMPRDPVQYAAQLYAALHTLDLAGVDRMVVELPPPTDKWLAVRDRLHRGSGQWRLA
jgi:L-threonylcarbamoyladenylate synthase